jgi:PAS domain S-box-containing protein
MSSAENNSEINPFLRRKAEEVLDNKVKSRFDGKLFDAITLKLIHELEVHQIELEMQNEELLLAKQQAEQLIVKYSKLYDYAPSGYFTLSTSGKIIEANLTGAAILGKERSNIINSQFGFFVSDDSQGVFNAFLNRVFESTVKETCEVHLITKNNNMFVGHLLGVVATDLGQCNITVIDITERKESELAVVESKKRYKGILDNLGEGIVVHATDSSIVMSNPKAAELLGLTEDQLKGKQAIDSDWKFFDENYLPLTVDKYPVSQILANKKPVTNYITAVQRGPAKDFVLLLINGFPVLDADGELIEIVISFIDITEIKQIQKELT